MRLDSADILELLPEWMKDETDIKALSLGTNSEAVKAYQESLILAKWDKIDLMTAEQLDSLAKELDIAWYRNDASLETKRKLVKNSDLVHKILGTKEAVEMVVDDYFGGGDVKEWFEYGGIPYHFRVASDNVDMVVENAALFKTLLGIVKRKSAWLDAIAVLIDETSKVYAGFCYRDFEKLTVDFGMEVENATY